MIERPDGVIIASREQRAREAARPVDDYPWCKLCAGDGRHEPQCPLIEDARELAGALAMGAAIEAMGKKPRG